MGAHSTFLYALSTANFVWLLGGLCQAHRVPWDSAHALQEFPPPHTIGTLREAAERHGLRLEEMDTDGFDWAAAAYPLIAFRRTDDETVRVPVLVTRCQVGRIQHFAPATAGPLAVPVLEFCARIEPVLLLVTPGRPPAEQSEARHGIREFLRDALGLKGHW